MNKNSWTSEEDSLLIQSKLDGLTYKEIHEKILINRSFNSIRVRGSLLINRGDLTTNTVRTNKTWTKEEEQQLINLKVEGKKYKEVAIILGKSEYSIQNKTNLLLNDINAIKNLKKEIFDAVKKYRTEEEYIARYDIASDIPNITEVYNLFGDWDTVVDLVSDKENNLLYYIKLLKENKVYYKIGITTRGVDNRFSSEKDIVIKTLKTWEFSTIEDARQAERIILSTFKRNKTLNKDILLKGGYTEVFEKDILNLDSEISS